MKAVLLVNIGSPGEPTRGAVARYLREFLGDGRVIDIPAVLRWLLVNLVIVPFRAAASARRYAKIWKDGASPLITISRAQQRGLAARLPEHEVALAMRYGEPAMKTVVDALVARSADELIVVPLFPQYASASTGSAVERVFELVRGARFVPSVRVVGAFWGEPLFLDALAASIEKGREGFDAQHLLLSYHGLPLKQLQDTTRPTGGKCGTAGCCDRLGPENHSCYRAQCFATSAALAGRLKAIPTSTAFQSRLRGEWIKPFTDEELTTLAASGVKRLLVACPSFVADCLETIEEIGEEARATFKAAGGEELKLVSCLNDDPKFLDALAQLVRR